MTAPRSLRWGRGDALACAFLSSLAPLDPDSVLCVTFGMRHLWGGRIGADPGAGTSFQLHADATLFTLGLSAHTRFGAASSE